MTNALFQTLYCRRRVWCSYTLLSCPEASEPAAQAKESQQVCQGSAVEDCTGVSTNEKMHMADLHMADPH